MSRSGYSDSLDEWALIRWRGAVKSAIRGSRGQGFLRELAAALDAMPEKRLIAHDLVAPSGDCCAMGAVCKSRGLDVSDLDPGEPEDVAEAIGLSRAMVCEIAYLNDEAMWVPETPEQRWTRMRAWVSSNLLPDSPTEPSEPTP